jgi:prolycopene isomerase
MPKKYDYDAIIIGAGISGLVWISGLVCGCYLAKAGMKVLIVEKNRKPGGYCSSFKRGGYTFDACVHSLGSLREGGNLNMILKELEIEQMLNIKRYDPSDIIFAPDCKINFYNELDKTILEFQDKFPKEAKNIKDFFNFIDQCEGASFSAFRSITFQDLLDKYFADHKLKAIFSLPLLGNAGLPAKYISAIIGILVYKEFMLDGGYYPDNSIQSFPEVLLQRYKNLGGAFLPSSIAKKIKIKSNRVLGVEIKNKGYYSSNYIISNADATHTFCTLIGKEYLDNKLITLLNETELSLSAFILYLGIKGILSEAFLNSIMWYLPTYNVEQYYEAAIENRIDDIDWFLMRISSNNSIFMLINVPYINEEYWKTNKIRLINIFIQKIVNVVPELSNKIVYKDAATPSTLYKRTFNQRGAAYGWARTPSQFAMTGLTQTTRIQNLYLTGHWTTLFQGVSGVAYLGRDTSKKIMNKETKI